MIMMRVSGIAARERLRRALRRQTIAEWIATGVAAIAGGGLVFVIVSGGRVPTIVIALLVTALTGSAVAGLTLAAIAVGTRALADRIDATGSQVADHGQQVAAMHRTLMEVCHQVAQIAEQHRAMLDTMRAAIRELGRMRMAERDREAMAAELSMAMERATRALAMERAQAARLHAALTRQRRAHEAALGAVIRRYRAELDRMAVDSKAAERRAREEGRAEGIEQGFEIGYKAGRADRGEGGAVIRMPRRRS
jgi:hypothetical protein